MRVNIYAEEITDRIEIVQKTTIDGTFTGVRMYLELPVTHNGRNVSGPFMHRDNDDDSAAVTFWGKRKLHDALRKMMVVLDERYPNRHDDDFDEDAT